MKIAILGDTHFGFSSSNELFEKHFEKFYSKVFFPYLKENGIEYIFQLGDLFDVRKNVAYVTLKYSKNIFFDKLVENKIHMVTLVGNHDSVYKNTIEVNSHRYLLDSYNHNISSFTSVGEFLLDDKKFLFIPWICQENEEEIMDHIKKSKAEICLGHFELDGFDMYKNIPHVGGLSPKILKKFKKVFSGHFHTQSIKGNIHYVGTPYEMTWGDYNDPKGFHVFDTETYETEFVQNPFNLFEKIVYNESTDVKEVEEKISTKFVKVVVEEKKDFKKFDKFISKIEESSPYDLKIVENLTDTSEVNISEEDVVLNDTCHIISSYINEMDTNLDKERLSRFVINLYNESLVNDNL